MIEDSSLSRISPSHRCHLVEPRRPSGCDQNLTPLMDLVARSHIIDEDPITHLVSSTTANSSGLLIHPAKPKNAKETAAANHSQPRVFLEQTICQQICPQSSNCPRLAASASCARLRSTLKNAGDCPINKPIAVRKLTTPIAIPLVSVGRMIEHTGSFRLRNGHGSGMIRFVWNSSPPKGGEFRSGKVTDTLVTGSTAVSGGAFPALSAQV